MDEVIEEIVEKAIRGVTGWDPSVRQREDGRFDPNLTVDFTYSAPHPGVALEITGLYRSEDRAANPEGIRLGAELTEIALREHWGTWFVSVKTFANTKLVAPEIATIIGELIGAGKGEVWIGSYTVDDLERADNAWGRHGAALHMKAHARMEELGIVTVKQLAGTEDVVAVVPMSDADIVGVSEPLQRTIDDNRGKLGRARPRETHLGVIVDRFDASRDPRQTPTPELSDEIDVLWVLHKWNRAMYQLPCLWSSNRGDRDWTLHDIDEPFESVTSDELTDDLPSPLDET
jgi:hypothetical protein